MAPLFAAPVIPKEGVDLTGQQSLNSSPLLDYFAASLIRAACAHWPLRSSQWTVCSTNRSCLREADINAGLKEGSGTLSELDLPHLAVHA